NGTNGPRRLTTLSLGVDERNNALVMACPDGLFKDIKKLVEEMDDASKQATQTIRVVSIQGIDPALVQQALDAIQGRVPRRPTTGGAFSPTGGGFGGPGFGGPGFGGRGNFTPPGGFSGSTFTPSGGTFTPGGGMFGPGGGMMGPGGGGRGG